MISLTNPITVVAGVGPAIAGKLRQVGVITVRDLLYYFPRRYDDYSNVVTIKDIVPGAVTIKGRVESVKGRYVRRGLHITEAIITDATGKVRTTWFNQPYRAKSLEQGGEMFLSGTFDMQRDRFVLQNPTVEKVSELTKNTARIVPVYRETKELKSYQIRRIIHQLLPTIKSLPELLPAEVLQSERLLPRHHAILQLHFPESTKKLQMAKERLAFEEIFELLLGAQLNKNEHQALTSHIAVFDEGIAKKFTEKLPFALTDAQRHSAWDILQDVAQYKPMNRLLQGDVGSGKTVVAALASAMLHANGLQSAFMAPTEILAMQHANTLAEFLEPHEIKLALLVGSTKPVTKKQIVEELARGEIDVVVGTHALLQDPINFAKLGLVVIDEQHRFGVAQRNRLLQKSEYMPHVLSMTATPIPRSLALTVYGELDVSIIDEHPPGRALIITEIHSHHSREQLYKKIDAEISKGRQVYVVCPLVSDSDKLGFKSVESEFTHLQQTVFRHRRIGLLHGKLSAKEKDEIMQQFQNHEIDILVTTTVVEVGVDVPNATIMMIEGADRFGLAQLHQLRGRVGRGTEQSYCYLIPSSAQTPSRRLQELTRSNDGFYLAEVDLDIRGPGEIYGLRQHGALDLKIARISDTKLISRVQKALHKFLQNGPNLLQYQELYKRADLLRRITTLN